MRQDWEIHGKASYRYVKEGSQVRTAILEKDDGTLTGNIQEMVGQFREQWLRYFRPYEPDQSPSWDDFERQFRETLEELHQAPLCI